MEQRHKNARTARVSLSGQLAVRYLRLVALERVMSVSSSAPAGFPDPESLADAFDVYEVEATDDGVRYYGEPQDGAEAVEQHLAERFRDRGYRVRLGEEMGEHVLVATERSTEVEGIPWLNVALFLATVGTTLLAGSQWYGVDLASSPSAILSAWPFAVAVLSVLAVHEFGHYVASRYHDVEATLPYFVPLPNALGTLGAVIRMKGHIPDREALFDIGVAGPLAGLVATVAVTAVGVSLPPIDVSNAGGFAYAVQYELGYPPLVQGIAALLGEPLAYGEGLAVNPVLVGGWVGAFVTFLNLLPVGQLDGAHVSRALVGDAVERLRYLLPLALFGLAGYLVAFADGRAAGIWILWGLLTLVFGRVGTATPLDDSGVDARRKAVGALALVAGALCFTPVPIVLT
jgi:membrane-associated protease RseP (regulator of RpoE activity)